MQRFTDRDTTCGDHRVLSATWTSSDLPVVNISFEDPSNIQLINGAEFTAGKVSDNFNMDLV